MSVSAEVADRLADVEVGWEANNACDRPNCTTCRDVRWLITHMKRQRGWLEKIERFTETGDSRSELYAAMETLQQMAQDALEGKDPGPIDG